MWGHTFDIVIGLLMSLKYAYFPLFYWYIYRYFYLLSFYKDGVGQTKSPLLTVVHPKAVVLQWSSRLMIFIIYKKSKCSHISYKVLARSFPYIWSIFMSLYFVVTHTSFVVSIHGTLKCPVLPEDSQLGSVQQGPVLSSNLK